MASSYPDLELILVDNASTDGSIEELKAYLKERTSRIKLIINDKNYGASYALDIGVKASSGKYISFVASDTRVDQDCFAQLIEYFESDEKIGAVESKLLLMDNPGQFDHAGEYLSQFGLLLQRHAGQEIDKGQFDQPAEIFSAKGTALTVRREAYQKAGGYDTDYFMFLEETDLCWRIWLSGYRIIFVPEAKIYHASGISIRSHSRSSFLAKYYGPRNYIATLFKNFGTMNLIKILPLHILLWFLLSLLFVFRLRLKESFYIIRGILNNFLNLPGLLKKRLKIQRLRVISDKELMPVIMRRVSFSYLLDRVGMW